MDHDLELLTDTSNNQERQRLLYPPPTDHEEVPGHPLLGSSPPGGAPQTMPLDSSLHTHSNQFQTAPSSSPAQVLVEENLDDRSWNINQVSRLQSQPQIPQVFGSEGTGLLRSKHLSTALNHIYY